METNVNKSEHVDDLKEFLKEKFKGVKVTPEMAKEIEEILREVLTDDKKAVQD